MANDITKLPRWAQDRIEVLERDKEWWMAKATAGPEDSNTFVHHLMDTPDTPLGDRPLITFVTQCTWTDHGALPQDHVAHIDARLQLDAGSIELRTRHGRLSVIPSASNSIIIRVVE